MRRQRGNIFPSPSVYITAESPKYIDIISLMGKSLTRVSWWSETPYDEEPDIRKAIISSLIDLLILPWTLDIGVRETFQMQKSLRKKHCDSIMKYTLLESKIYSTAIKWWTKRSRHGCFFLSQSVCMEVNLEFNKLWLNFLAWSRWLVIFFKTNIKWEIEETFSSDIY